MYGLIGWNNKYFLLGLNDMPIAFDNKKMAKMFVKQFDIHNSLLVSIVKLDDLKNIISKNKNESLKISNIVCNKIYLQCLTFENDQATIKTWLNGDVINITM